MRKVSTVPDFFRMLHHISEGFYTITLPDSYVYMADCDFEV